MSHEDESWTRIPSDLYIHDKIEDWKGIVAGIDAELGDSFGTGQYFEDRKAMRAWYQEKIDRHSAVLNGGEHESGEGM